MPEKLTLVAGDYDIKSRSSHPKRGSTHKRKRRSSRGGAGIRSGRKDFLPVEPHGGISLYSFF